MAISLLDTITTGGTPTAGDVSQSVTVPTGTTAIILSISSYRGAVGAESNSIIPTTVSYNSAALTYIDGAELSSTNRRYFAGLYYKVNPSTGSNTFVIDQTFAGVNSVWSIYALSGVNTSSLVGATQKKTVSNSTGSPNDNITTTSANSWIAAACFNTFVGTNPNLAEVSGTTESALYATDLANPWVNLANGYRGITGAAGSYNVGWTNDTSAGDTNRIILQLAEINNGSVSVNHTKSTVSATPKTHTTTIHKRIYHVKSTITATAKTHTTTRVHNHVKSTVLASSKSHSITVGDNKTFNHTKATVIASTKTHTKSIVNPSTNGCCGAESVSQNIGIII